MIADKYIEFEPIVIVIDLVLLSRPTYRHVLYNTDFKVSNIFTVSNVDQQIEEIFNEKMVNFLTKFQIHWKMALIFCLVDAYISWSNKTQVFAPDMNYPQFTKEKMFYFCFGLAIAGMFSLNFLLNLV